jgi:hypothetical protein
MGEQAKFALPPENVGALGRAPLMVVIRPELMVIAIVSSFPR